MSAQLFILLNCFVLYFSISNYIYIYIWFRLTDLLIFPVILSNISNILFSLHLMNFCYFYTLYHRVLATGLMNQIFVCVCILFDFCFWLMFSSHWYLFPQLTFPFILCLKPGTLSFLFHDLHLLRGHIGLLRLP